MKPGIIFDMDGTLWDSAKEVVDAWNLIIKELPDKDHLVSLEEIYSLMGKTMDEIAAEVFPNMEINRRNEIMEKCCEIENDYLKNHGGQLYPKLETTLKQLQKTYDLFIVSNCQCGYIEAFLAYYGFSHYFKDFESFGNTLKLKAENIKSVVERNHLEQAVYVGDTLGDYTSTMEAGIDFIYAAYGFGEAPEAKYKIEAFENLPKVLEEIF